MSVANGLKMMLHHYSSNKQVLLESLTLFWNHIYFVEKDWKNEAVNYFLVVFEILRSEYRVLKRMLQILTTLY